MQNGLHFSPDLSLFIRSVLSATEMHGGKTKLLCPIYSFFFYLLLCSSFSIPFSNRVEGRGRRFMPLVIWRHIFCFLQPLYQTIFFVIKKTMEKTDVYVISRRWRRSVSSETAVEAVYIRNMAEALKLYLNTPSRNVREWRYSPTHS